MTNEQISRFNMFLATVAYCEANLSVAEKLPNFPENLASLKKTNLQIQLVGELQKLDRKGVTKGKNQLRSQLVTIAADVARKLTAYATFSNLPQLLGEVNFSESALNHFADSELKDYAQIIYDKAQSNLPSLVKYELTSETQTFFLSAINDFNALLGIPRVSASSEVQATKQLSGLFKTSYAAIKNLDKAVEIVRLSQPNFYTGYRSVRKIVGSGEGKLSLKVKVLDKQTNEPIKGVAIKMTIDTGSTDNELVRSEPGKVIKTATKGGVYLKSLVAGTYLVLFKKDGYAEKIVKTHVNDGEMTNVVVALEKE